MLLKFDIVKDLTDYIWGWGTLTGTLLGAVIIPILIWFFGSSRADARRIKEKEIENLNYLIMMAYRYFQYLQTLDRVVIESKNKMIEFINNPNEETKFAAFHEIVPPMLKFDISTNDYAFTIKNQSNLIDLLFKFLSLMDELQTHIRRFNADSSMVYNPTIPMENYIKTAKGYVDLNLMNFSATIWLALYVLHRLFETTYAFEKFLKPSGLICTYISPEIVNYMNSVILKLNKLYENETWQRIYDDAIEPIRQNFYQKIYANFKKKFFRKNLE